MNKSIKLTLVKDPDQLTVLDENNLRVVITDDSDQGRKEVIHYLVEEFFNKEVEDGRKYQ